jgi:sugar lactone lactonase YvrE
MDRLAGTQPAAENTHVRFLLNQPYGVAIDSKGRVYTPDQKVGAIFIFNTETREAELIKNKVDAHFVQIIGIAMDDNDRLFVGDPGLKHVLVLNADHKPEAAITEGMVSPGGLAIDRENRLLYVSDVALDQVLVYDADSFKLLRKIGRTGHNHELTEPGDLAKPTGLAVDRDGNLYVCDTLNDRIEIFDADGNFIRTYGKNGDGPADFTRPKGVALDSDNHIWVADGMQDRLQVFNQEWRLLIVVGGHGLLPGMFQGLSGIAIDKNNRVFTSEIYPGRIQQFQYVTDAQFDAEKKRREEKGVSKTSVSSVAAPATAAPPAESKSAK